VFLNLKNFVRNALNSLLQDGYLEKPTFILEKKEIDAIVSGSRSKRTVAYLPPLGKVLTGFTKHKALRLRVVVLNWDVII
jgi:hypothetical protein